MGSPCTRRRGAPGARCGAPAVPLPPAPLLVASGALPVFRPPLAPVDHRALPPPWWPLVSRSSAVPGGPRLPVPAPGRPGPGSWCPPSSHPWYLHVPGVPGPPHLVPVSPAPPPWAGRRPKPPPLSPGPLSAFPPALRPRRSRFLFQHCGALLGGGGVAGSPCPSAPGPPPRARDPPP